MAHSHEHQHRQLEHADARKAFVVGIALNLLFVVAEAVAGLIIHSLSLISDAGHNLADVGALALSLLAVRLTSAKPNETFTYGYRRSSTLVALFNAIVLLVSIGAIAFGAVRRFFAPEPIPGLSVAVIAGLGIVINTASALLFTREKNSDLNVRSAYMHLMADAAISAGLVAGGIIMYFTHWYWLDPALSMLLAITIVFSAWRLLRESLFSSLDAVPGGVSIERLKTIALGIAGVKEMHHVHVWMLSASENALTAHVVLARETTIPQEHQIKDALKHALEENNIHHVTLETERESENCEKEEC